jgi:drug/metabolite transporter (DMT)-like permease
MPRTSPRRTAYLPILALTFLALLWGYNWVVMKVGVRDCNPFAFSALRNVLGAFALFGIALARGSSFRLRPFWWIVLFSIVQTSLSALPVWGLVLGSAGRVAVLTYTMPFWILLIAWPVLGERIRGVQWVAVALAFAGLIFIVDPLSLRGWAASLLAIGGGLAWAIASVLFKIIRKRAEVDLLPFTAWQTLIGSIPLVVVALIVAPEGPTWSGSFIAALIYNVACSAVYVIWLYVLHNLPAGTAGISILAVPVIGVLAAWIQLEERPGALEAVGMGLILAALAALTMRGVLASRQTPLLQPAGEAAEFAIATPGAAGEAREAAGEARVPRPAEDVVGKN